MHLHRTPDGMVEHVQGTVEVEPAPDVPKGIDLAVGDIEGQ